MLPITSVEVGHNKVGLHVVIAIRPVSHINVETISFRRWSVIRPAMRRDRAEQNNERLCGSVTVGGQHVVKR